jgi:protein arginine kinase activator
MHITEVRKGEVQSLHLCDACAQEYLDSVEVGAPPKELPAPAAAEATDDEADTGVPCPFCGITFKQFRSQGRFGCPHDYEIFHDEIVPLLESVHSDTQHVGKCPPRTSPESRQRYELFRLRNELKTAIENESYEDAARVRDRIRELENQLGPAPTATDRPT